MRVTSDSPPSPRPSPGGGGRSDNKPEKPMSNHQFSRRTMLRGLGVTMALPWLESLRVWGDEPRGNAKASEAPVRLAVLFAGNGFHGKEWWAKGEGRGMELGQVLAPLTDLREKLLFIRGLFNAEA